jgi:hypothetical protein
MYGRWLIVFACNCAVLALLSTGSQSQQAQPKFTSGGIQVVVNRAVLQRGGQSAFAPVGQAQLVISLIVTNLGDDDVAIIAQERPTVITDIGGAAQAERLSGLQVSTCHSVYPAPECVRSQGLTPTLVERNNSITVTMFFWASSDTKVCSVDFSMPVFIQRGGGKGRDDWRQITVGLPNVMVC